MSSPEAVNDMFAAIAPRYDLVNTVLSFGMHHLWRRKVVKLSGVGQGDNILDCATGTGDLALIFKRKVGLSGRVVGVDFCAPMLKLAADKADRKGLELHLKQTDVLDLPFDDGEFDCASIAFGIRSIDDRAGCLREMARVVKSGGRVLVLEFGQPRGRLFGPLYRWYSKHALPRLGGLLSGNHEAYAYLPKTAATFPDGTRFVDLMDQACVFCDIKALSLSGGITWIYIGIVDKK